MASKSDSLFSLSAASLVPYLKRHRYLTVALASWVVMVALTVVFVMPQLQRISTNAANLKTEEQKFNDLKAKVTFLRSLNRSEVDANNKILQDVLPAYKPVLPLISSMEQLAGEAGVALKSMELNPGSVATEGGKLDTGSSQKSAIPGVYGLPLKLEVQGTFVSMNTFFKSLDRLLPLVNVKNIQFAAGSSAGGGEAQYKATVELESLYIAGTDIPKVAITAQLPQLTAGDKKLIASLSATQQVQPQIVAPNLSTGSGSGVLRSSVFDY